MASVITLAFENWKAQEAASGKAVLLDEFVFANVPNLDPTQPIDRNEKLPPANQIVHRQAVNKAGLASENAVAYSVTMGADVGNFDFNWIGLLNKASGTVAMITHAPTQKKLKNQNGQQGNVLTRSFILEFQGAAEETQIKTSAETWQIDFTARLSGIDEMQRLINLDSYGAAAFFDESFEVTRSGEQFTVKKGLGYIGGLRGELTQNQILNGLRNTKVYADFSYQGNIVSQWNTVVKITAAATLNNYVDAAGFTHQVFAIASIDASGNVKDLRPMGALSSQEISALETRFKLDLSKKIDKANISSQKGNDNDKVPSLDLLTTEVGKLQPKGDYATNESVDKKLTSKVSTSSITQETGGYITYVMSQSAVTRELNKKFETENVSTVKGNDAQKVPSLSLFTSELDKKLDKSGGEITGKTTVVGASSPFSLQKFASTQALILAFLDNEGNRQGYVGLPGTGNEFALVNSITGKPLSLGADGGLRYDGLKVLTSDYLPKRSFNENDSIRIPDEPGGLIVQWGKNTGERINFPIQFPNKCLWMIQVPNVDVNEPHGLVWHAVKSFDKSGFIRYTSTTIVTTSCYFLAIGF
ncbi:phage tail protein [Providencia rettgeri]|uniref:phage tail-collar fiber domain-containing protein n=1 Tax=Providencia rettgeri TaxID=587 RepID=UPI0020529A8E|nr:phage tail protein [Providencia rettgeri]UPS62269.1 phage tail protein [Providencia rettgeri]